MCFKNNNVTHSSISDRSTGWINDVSGPQHEHDGRSSSSGPGITEADMGKGCRSL